MNFTQDWFTHNIPNFEKCMEVLGNQNKQFLEIGAYEGRSTCWLIKHMDNLGSITSIDPFPNMPEIQERFLENVREACVGTRVIPCFMKKTSIEGLAQIINCGWQYDFIYIDGSHAPHMAITDACMSWPVLRSGGVMLFDDYEYPHEPTKIGINAFLDCFDGQYDLVLKNYQLAVRKK